MHIHFKRLFSVLKRSVLIGILKLAQYLRYKTDTSKRFALNRRKTLRTIRNINISL